MSSTTVFPQVMPNQKLQEITLASFKADPFAFYAQLRREQPIARAKLGRVPVWLITRYDDVMAILKDDTTFVKNHRQVQSIEQQKRGPWYPKTFQALEKNMLLNDNPDHVRLRSLVHKAFTPSRIEQLRPHIQQLTESMLIATQQRRSGDLIVDLALPLPLLVIAELLGIPAEDRMRFHHWANAMMRPRTHINMLRLIPTIYRQLKYVEKLFVKRRNEPRDDLMTALLQAEDAGDHFSEDELVAMVFLLVLAGHETTVNLISLGTLALLQHPDQLALLRRSPELIKPAIEELLRFTAPVETATERFVSQDTTFRGIEFKRGETVLAVLASANRDKQYVVNGDQLDITREKNRHVGFGYGIHYCLGAALARMEAQIAIQLLLEHRPNLRLAIPAEQLRWRSTVTVRGVDALPLIW